LTLRFNNIPRKQATAEEQIAQHYLEQAFCMLTTAIPDVEIMALCLFVVWF